MEISLAAALKAYRHQIEEGLTDIARHCALSSSDIASLGAARFRLTRTSAVRTHYINEAIIFALLQNTDKALNANLKAMQMAFSCYQAPTSANGHPNRSKRIRKAIARPPS